MTIHKMFLSLALFAIQCTNSLQAAKMEILWGDQKQYQNIISKFSLNLTGMDEKSNTFLSGMKFPDESIHQLKYINKINHTFDSKHIRLSQHYQEIPVFGHQIIVHKQNNSNYLITGSLITDYEKDLADKSYQLTPAQVKTLLTQQNNNYQLINVSKYIYIDEKDQNIAKYSYRALVKSNDKQAPILKEIFIDGENGAIIKSYDLLNHHASGTGYGGVDFNSLPYRDGQYQFGDEQQNIYQFPSFPVTYTNNSCEVSNDKFKIFNLENKSLSQLPFSFPVSYSEIQDLNIKPFKYACSIYYHFNANDGGFAPVNGGYSPINDVTFFLNKTYHMYESFYKFRYPLGYRVPVYIFTHIDRVNNSVIYHDSNDGEYPVQIMFGNGNESVAPSTSAGIVSHEFAHRITKLNSSLIYEGQSGGINESFSDMAHIAFLAYLKIENQWIWAPYDWGLNKDINRSAVPLRHMDNPTLDGISIDHADKYRAGMDVHYSSGVFNKAFYLVSSTPGWSPLDAFGVFLHANKNYWTPSADFNFAACGVMLSAKDLNKSSKDVDQAFKSVGVSCPYINGFNPL